MHENNSQPEQPRSYLNHWHDFALEHQDDLGITDPESFQRVVWSNEQELLRRREEAGQTPSPTAIEQWYMRLGSLNDLTGAERDLASFASGLDRAADPNAHTELLHGVLCHELGLATNNDELSAKALGLATKSYEAVLKRPDLDWNDQHKRNAAKYHYDLLFVAVQAKAEQGVDVSQHYVELQRHYIRDFLEIAESDVANGELFEWSAAMLLRHRNWVEEDYAARRVRQAFPREDKPYDGLGKARSSFPSWAFDLEVKDRQGIQQWQMKADREVRPGDYGQPVKVVKTHFDNIKFRQRMTDAARIIDKSYAYSETVEEDRVLESWQAQFAA